MMAARNKQSAKQAAFLAAYGQTGNLTRAATIAGCDRSMHRYWLDKDAEYPARFEQAHEKAIEFLEDEARRRATEGLRRYKFHQGQPIIDPATGEPYYELEYSDTLLIFLLKAARPEKYRDRVDHRHGGHDGGPLTLRIVEEIVDGGDGDKEDQAA